MCQGVVLVYSCRHRQVGEIHICDAARRSASNASCMASFTYMLTGREPKRSCGDVKTSRRHLPEPCLACHVQADLHGEPILSTARAYANIATSPSTNPNTPARHVSPHAKTGSFRAEPSKYITQPYVGELMSTSNTAATPVAVSVAMPKSAVLAATRGRTGARPPPSAGSPSSTRPQSRGRSRATSSTTSTNNSRNCASKSAQNLPGPRKTGRRSQSAARRFATADRLSAVVEDSIPMVPIKSQGSASSKSKPSPSTLSSPSSRLAPPPPVRRSDAPSRSTMASSSSRSKGKGKDVMKDLPKLPSSSTSTSSYKRREVVKELPKLPKLPTVTSTPTSTSSYKSKVAKELPKLPSSPASKAKLRSPKAGSSSSPLTPSKTGSRPRSFSNRLLASKKVAKSEESFLCADAARIEGRGNFI